MTIVCYCILSILYLQFLNVVVQTSFKSHGCLLDVSAFAFQVSKCSLIISILFESLRYELNVWEGCISMCFAIVETC